MAAITNIAGLQSNAGLVSEDLVKRSAVWHHGGEDNDVEFFVRRLAFGDIDRVYSREDPTNSQAAELIAMAVRLGEDGSEQMSYEQAYQLNAGLAMLFSDHVMSVNGVGDEKAKTDPKASAVPKSSGSK
jgi:hypothetical protein